MTAYLVIVGLTVSLLAAIPVAAAEYRCQTYCPYWNQCYSRCAWFYSEQEIYERGMAAAERNLDYNSQGGTRMDRRPPLSSIALSFGLPF
jgi:hypothetical protein